MEFQNQAGENRDPYFLPSSSSDGYFAAQALRARFFGGGVGGDMERGGLLPPISPREALMRELQKERILEELLLREIAQKRILEVAVRRELELERAMAMRRFEAERFSFFGGGRMESEPFVMESRVGGMGSSIVQPNHEVRADERSPLAVRPNAIVRKSPGTEIMLPNPKLSGTKRKAAGELPLPAKEWSCALCQVSTPGQVALNEHLLGKKHRAIEALLGANKSKKIRDTSSADGLMKKIAERKWSSDLCQVRVYKEDVLNEHLQGKKHRARAKEALLDANNEAAMLEKSERDEDGAGGGAPPVEVVKKVTDETVKRGGGDRGGRRCNQGLQLI